MKLQNRYWICDGGGGVEMVGMMEWCDHVMWGGGDLVVVMM